jgi:cell division protein FtsN
MTRDYAKRGLSGKKTKKKSLSYLVLWLLVLTLFVVFTLGLVCLGKHKQRSRVSKRTQKTIITPAQRQTPAKIKIKEKIAPMFDFYTILPQTSNSSAASEYNLEVATIKDYAAADHLKAKLALLGFTASIFPIKANGVKKYQVSVGAYDNKDDANADLERLKQNKIRSELKKVR